MEIGEIIRENRKKKGITQEQLGLALHVSAQAVNKWENGKSFPDITLLPGLARQLGVDMNDLFGFHDSLSESDMDAWLEQLQTLLQRDGIKAAYDKARELFRQYPDSAEMMACVAFLMENGLRLAADDFNGRQEIENQILAWYEKSAQSKNQAVAHTSAMQVARKKLERGEWSEAERWIHTLPAVTVDRSELEIASLQKQGKTKEACAALSEKALNDALRLVAHWMGLADALERDKKTNRAIRVLQVVDSLVQTLGLYPAVSDHARLRMALMEKDKKNSLFWIETILNAPDTRYELVLDPLFKDVRNRPDPALLNRRNKIGLTQKMETDPAYAFLRDDPVWKEKIKKAKR